MPEEAQAYRLLLLKGSKVRVVRASRFVVHDHFIGAGYGADQWCVVEKAL